MDRERNAYLYARNNGSTDQEAARFVDWFTGSGFANAEMPERYCDWLEMTEAAK